MSRRKANLLDYLYNAWCVFWLVVVFLALFPFIFICIQVKSWNWLGTRLTNVWADIFFFITGLWVKTEYHFRPDKKGHYIFVANHFSYLDVAVGMKVVRNYFSYMGKSSVKKVPLLGYMFARLHIQVDRSDKNSRVKSFKRSMKALADGRSLFIMPEGGILSETIPVMKQPFKDGAFVLAMESKTPIVPITFVNLYRIMPGAFIFWDFPRVVIHEPVFPEGKTMDELKQEVYTVIQTEIDAHRHHHP
ncbi:MAG: 1-acyl-sn-glycerol-3-phosphate acyltransferase [Leadbetterella sp.]|nr:1-acyl-sn-glycerol-3-phosphate acyltransferase [Leadbetterella sp.]